MIDYTILYKKCFGVSDQWASDDAWDVLISSYVPNERVEGLFELIPASQKVWMVFPEYGYSPSDIPGGTRFVSQKRNESEYIHDFWQAHSSLLDASKICIDITGFLRPHLAFLVRWLYENGVRNFDAVYSEPSYYRHREQTIFSTGGVEAVRQISGFEGEHRADTSNDLLVVNAGYEEDMIARAAEAKDGARRVLMYGFPPLRADMYQENVLKASLAGEFVGSGVREPRMSWFAPAGDPFVTASVLNRMIRYFGRTRKLTNVYLCPVATKAQLLGFVLFYLWECKGREFSLIYPFCSHHEPDTSRGIARVWVYRIQLPTN